MQSSWSEAQTAHYFPTYYARPNPSPTFAQVSGSPGRQRNRLSWVPARGMRKAGQPTFPQVSPPLARLVAGEGFEPSNLSRRIYRRSSQLLRPACLRPHEPLPRGFRTTTRTQPTRGGHNRTMVSRRAGTPTGQHLATGRLSELHAPITEALHVIGSPFRSLAHDAVLVTYTAREPLGSWLANQVDDVQVASYSHCGLPLRCGRRE